MAKRSTLARLVLVAICALMIPAMSPSIGWRLAAWLTPWGGHLLLAVLLFVVCLFMLNRVVLGLYQEFINRE